jgi:small ligand-binding sensory domain FIST
MSHQEDASLEDCNADLLFHLIQYLNVEDMASFSRQSRRMYYLTHQYRLLRGPQLISVASYYGNDPLRSGRRNRRNNRSNRSNSQPEHYTNQELYDQVMAKLQDTPNLALSFSTTEAMDNITTQDRDDRSDRYQMHDILQHRNPSNTVILGAIADTIQSSGIQHTNLPRMQHSQQQKSDVDNFVTHECQSNSSLMMLAGLSSNTSIQPFLLSCDVDDVQTYVNTTFRNDTDWKMFILYVVGDGGGIADALVSTLQSKFTTATIVGGICTAAYVSTPIIDSNTSIESLIANHTTNELIEMIFDLGGSGVNANEPMTQTDAATQVHNLTQEKKYKLSKLGLEDQGAMDGICGVALAGDVPVRSVVSRGVESLSSKYNNGDGVPTSRTTLYVHESEMVNSVEGYILSPPSSHHLIRKIRDDSTGKIYTVDEIVNVFGYPDFIGFRDSCHDGFPLETPHPVSMQLNAFLMIASSSLKDFDTLTGANVDFFDLSGKQCMNDMTYCMEQLKDQTKTEEILGAVMFSCNGRGPRAGMFITEPMADAKRFANAFPNVQCLGFYAGGEIGPLALAGRQSVFQQGNSCVQGFTAVFALFIVPSFNWDTTRGLDDSDACIARFIQNRLHSSSPNN